MTGEVLAAHNAPAAPMPWRWWQRALFRFSFAFWALWLLQSGILWQATALTPFVARWVLPWPLRILNWPVQTITHLLATHVFHLTGVAATYHQTGSGDTALAWTGMLAMLLCATDAGGVWTAASEMLHRRTEYRTLYAFLGLGLRVCLGAALLSYGFSKVFQMQFNPPGLRQLTERYGDASPMGLLWTFMGYSIPYTLFAGLAEITPGLLLLFRRTATLGSLLAAAVLLNVVLLNFCYDVPVKLYSSTLLLLSLFLLLPDFPSLWSFLVRHRSAQLRPTALPKPQRRHLRITAHCLQGFVIASLLYGTISDSYSAWWRHPGATTGRARLAATNDPQSIDGSWTVDSSTGWPPGAEWVTVSIGTSRHGSNDYLQILERNGSHWYVLVSTDANQTIHFLRKENTELHWSADAGGRVTLQGRWLNKPATLTMRPATGAEFPLNLRGFHWVQEYPFNH